MTTSPLRAFAIVLVLLSLTATRLAAEENIITADQIRANVVLPEPTRSWPMTRKGVAFEGGDRSWSLNRSLILVETEVQVEPDAKIAVPIRFKLGSPSELDGAISQRQLDELTNALQTMPAGVELLIEGHTCSKGETDHNDRLSLARANYIVDHLVKHGVSSKALKAIGCGEAEAARDDAKDTDGEAVLAPYRKVMLHQIMVQQ